MAIGWFYTWCNEYRQLSGETIDYGLCAFMDIYDPATVFSSIDRRGCYAYGNQPSIVAWNLARFAETLLPLLHDNQDEAVEQANEIIQGFKPLFHRNWLAGRKSKLGFFNEEPEDKALIDDLLKLMHQNTLDYTNTFIALTFDKPGNSTLFEKPDFTGWIDKWRARLSRQHDTKTNVQKLMKTNNPAVIPHNHRVEAALEAAVKHNDCTVFEKLPNILSNPYAHTPEQFEYASPPEPSCSPYQTFCGT